MNGLARYDRVILWGCNSAGNMSHRWIWSAFQKTLHRLGHRSLWVPDVALSRHALQPGSIVFAIDIDSHELGSAVAGVDYVLHNCAPGHPVYEGMRDDQYIGLQVYTTRCEQWGEAWGPYRRWDGRTLFQPWGTDLLAEEFYEPVFTQTSREAVFVGAVWNTDGQGNVGAIDELKRALSSRGLGFRHLEQVSDEQNVAAVRGARLAPAVAGDWQCAEGYIPCRGLKNISYGALGISNVPAMQALLGEAALPGETIDDLIGEAVSLRQGRYLDLVRAQQRVVAGFTYRESLAAIGRALDAVKSRKDSALAAAYVLLLTPRSGFSSATWRVGAEAHS